MNNNNNSFLENFHNKSNISCEINIIEEITGTICLSLTYSSSNEFQLNFKVNKLFIYIYLNKSIFLF